MNRSCPNTKQTGFTLIELLITTALTVMLMLTITTMFMTFLVGNSKTNIRKKVKEEGLYAISRIEFALKNAHYFDEGFAACTTGMNSIRVANLDETTTTFNEVTADGVTKIASDTEILTSATVDSNSTLNFDCSGTTGNRQVKVSFTLEKTVPTLGADETISESFETIVNIRN